jgi:hypothetical protein
VFAQATLGLWTIESPDSGGFTPVFAIACASSLE